MPNPAIFNAAATRGAPTRRVLVLGSDSHPKGVTAYGWDKLPKHLNVADFDVLILNFMTIPLVKGLEERIDTGLLPTMEQMLRLWFSPSAEIIVIGGPAQNLCNYSNGVQYWCPLYLESRSEPGRSIRDVDSNWAFYFDDLGEYVGHFTGRFTRPNYVDNRPLASMIVHEAEDFTLSMQPLARTRALDPIGAEIRLAVTRPDGYASQRLMSSEPLYWLPFHFKLPPTEVVNRILRERYGFVLEHAAPVWSAAFVTPDELPIRERIAGLRATIEAAHDQLAQEEQAAADAGRLRRLLYETGEDALEPVVRDALVALGATVTMPHEKGREDGRITDPQERNLILEVKGRTGSLKLDDVRQLQDWVTRMVAEDSDWEGKGLLIINPFCETPPADRGEPFPENATKFAKRFGHALMTTTQLYQAVIDMQAGRLDPGTVWTAIEEASGRVNLPEIAMPREAGQSAA